MLVRGDGYIISSPERSVLGALLDDALLQQVKLNKNSLAETFYTEYEGEKLVIISVYNSEFNNYLMATFPYRYITDETSRINQRLLLLAAILIALCLCLTLIVYTSIMQPIQPSTIQAPTN